MKWHYLIWSASSLIRGTWITAPLVCLLASFFCLLAVGEHWEGKGTSQPSFYMGGKWFHSIVSTSVKDYWIIQYAVTIICFVQNSIGGVSHLSGDHVNEPFMWVSINQSQLSSIYFWFCNWFPWFPTLLYLPFDRGEDGVSGVLLHHKQVIKPY